jgi:hypothetical protein
MTEVRTVARQIQQLEIYLNNLVSALTRGELPVNLQPVTQIFDRAIESITPTLNLPQDRFIELYNDLPHLFTAYAIDVTLSEDSYHRQTNEIIFHRFARGNYWIVPIQSAPEQGWLVPNPLKGLSIDRMQSLDTSFDRDIIPNHSNNNCILVAPALVQILPIVEPLTWKLLESGKLTNSQLPKLSTPTAVIESLVEKLIKLNDRVSQIERESTKNESTSISTDKQAQLQSIVTQIVKQLEVKQQEILALTTQLAESISRSTRQDREIAALKVQIDSISQTSRTATISPVTDTREIVSLKVELERLKTDYQSYQRQQDKSQRDLIANMKILIAQEIDKIQPASIQPELETIDGEIVTLDPVPPQKSSSTPVINEPIANKSISLFASLYNSGEKAFLRSYMVSTATVKISNSNKIELVEDNVGHYWIVPFDSAHYLVPKMDFPNYSKCLEALALLFDGANDCTNFTLFKPAIVSITKASMPKQWKLEQKGYLDSALATQ